MIFFLLLFHHVILKKREFPLFKHDKILRRHCKLEFPPNGVNSIVKKNSYALLNTRNSEYL